MPALDGRTIALLESRRGAELDALVRQAGGTPVRAASVREVARPDDVARFAEGLAGDRFEVVVFLTGAGVHALLDESLDGTVAALRRCTVASRGPKPLAALKRYGVAAHVMTAKPHTSDELVDAVARVDLDRRRVALVHYGERNPSLSAALRGMGAYQLSWFDAHLWAYAECNGLDELVSEDFQHGRIYGRVRANNPFA